MKTSSFVVCAFAALVALGGCSNKIPKDKLEAAIKTAFDKEGVKFKSLSCPADREIKAGDKFECAGELEEGAKATVSVTQKNDKGSLVFDVLGSVEKESGIGEFITKKGGTKTEAKCPRKITVVRKGDSYTCDLTQGADKGKVTITGTDDDKVNYKVEMEGKPAAAAMEGEAEAPVESSE